MLGILEVFPCRCETKDGPCRLIGKQSVNVDSGIFGLFELIGDLAPIQGRGRWSRFPWHRIAQRGLHRLNLVRTHAAWMWRYHTTTTIEAATHNAGTGSWLGTATHLRDLTSTIHRIHSD